MSDQFLMKSVAFKEWAVVCEALLDGRQLVIIRKGGIAEGRAGFEFKYDGFFLMPTRFHEQVAKTVLPWETPLPDEPPEGMIVIAAFCKVEAVTLVSDFEMVRRLASYHILSEATVAERFGYGDARGVHVALVRTFRISPKWVLADSPKFGGCRSWVDLPEPGSLKFEPVLSDSDFDVKAGAIRAIVGC